jgi:hypothetical protein
VSDKGRWSIATYSKASESVAIGGLNAYYASNHKLTVPKGSWKLSYSGTVTQNSSVSGIRSAFFTLSDSSTWTTSTDMVSRLYQRPSADIVLGMVARSTDISLTTETVYILYGGIDAATSTETWATRGDQGAVVTTALPSRL